MDMLENMRAFVAVAKTGSFTAAQALDLATSVVTKRVSQLERSVGTVLLHRTTRRVTLSADGEYHLGTDYSHDLEFHDETLAAIRIGQQRLEGTVAFDKTITKCWHRPFEIMEKLFKRRTEWIIPFANIYNGIEMIEFSYFTNNPSHILHIVSHTIVQAGSIYQGEFDFFFRCFFGSDLSFIGFQVAEVGEIESLQICVAVGGDKFEFT